MRTGADDARGRLDFRVEAEQAALRDLRQHHADRHLLACPGGADVGDVDAGADAGLSIVEERLDEIETGVFDETDHSGGRKDAVHMRGPHVRGHQVRRFAGQAGAEHVGGHDA